jgi:hypothetical protein
VAFGSLGSCFEEDACGLCEIEINFLSGMVQKFLTAGPDLDALTARKVFGWRNVHKHDGVL